MNTPGAVVVPMSLLTVIWTGPVVVLFSRWAWAVWHDESAADFEHTMRMNQVSSLCLSAAFIAMLLWRHHVRPSLFVELCGFMPLLVPPFVLALSLQTFTPEAWAEAGGANG